MVLISRRKIMLITRSLRHLGPVVAEGRSAASDEYQVVSDRLVQSEKCEDEKMAGPGNHSQEVGPVGESRNDSQLSTALSGEGPG